MPQRKKRYTVESYKTAYALQQRLGATFKYVSTRSLIITALATGLIILVAFAVQVLMTV
jgi:hypothetical protein